jgi:hypothetical protein
MLDDGDMMVTRISHYLQGNINSEEQHMGRVGRRREAIG